MDYKVFVGYASEDNDKAQYIYYCLGRIVEILPYKAELYKAYGEDFKQRIQKELEESHFMVVLLTNNGISSQWVNQEIEYAYALKRRPQRQYKELPFIIPISEKQVQLKGFITKDTTDILFLDDFPSFHYIVANIFLAMRSSIPKGFEEGVFHLRVTCSNCFDKKGFPFEYNAIIPDVETVRKFVESNQPIIQYTCPQCNAKNFIDARTFTHYDIAEI